MAGPVASWLFTAEDGSRHLWEIRLVLGLTIGVLALQSVSASLNGLLRLREVNRVNLVTSLLTLLTVYPFLLLGRIGLTFVIGFTCFIGSVLGILYLQKAIGHSLFRIHRPRSWAAFRAVLPISPWLALQPILNTGSALTVQIALSRHYGLDSLGLYNAAAMIETTSITVLMSSMRSYYLPTLGRFASFTEKRVFVNKILSVLLVLLLVGVMTLVMGAPLAVKILFSGAFGHAEDIVRILALSMVGQVLVWCSALFLIHGADYRTFVLLDSAWASVRVLGTVLCAALDAPLQAVAWVHVGSYALSVVFYTISIRARYRAFLIDRMNGVFSFLVLALLVGAKFIVLQGPLVYQIIFVLLVAVICGGAGTYAWRRLRV
jgi:O-antigen/teichoic acid export membrane protein